MKSIKITTVGGLYKTIISWQKAILLGVVAIAIVGCNDGKSSSSNKNTNTYANATSEIKVICDRDGESVYLNNQFKSTCDNGDPVPMKAQAGKYTVEVKKDNGNGSYYYYKKSFRIGNGVEKIVEANSNIHYTEKYYYIKAKKSKKVKDYWTYLKKYPHGKYVTIAKNYLDGYYWKRCNSIDGCKTYLSKVTWGTHRTKAKKKLENYYFKNEVNDIVYAWKYLKKYPNGKYTKQTKINLDNYYYKQCKSITSCNEYLNKINWDDKRKKKVKMILEKLYAKHAISSNNYNLYLNKYPNGKYYKKVLEEKMYNNILKNYKISYLIDYIKTYPKGKYSKKVKFYLSHIYNKIKIFKTTKNLCLPLDENIGFSFKRSGDNSYAVIAYLKNLNDIKYHNMKNINFDWNFFSIFDYFPIINNSNLIISSNHNIYSINLNNYKIIWHKQFAYIFDVFQDVHNNIYILFGNKDNRHDFTPKIIKLDPKTGKLLSSISFKKKLYSPYFFKAIKYKHDFIIALRKYNSYSTLLLRMDNRGKIIWKKRLNHCDDDPSRLSVLQDGTFVFNARYNLLRIDGNGNILWDKKMPEDSIYAIYNDVIILFSSKNGYLQIKEFETNGKEFWKQKFKYQVNDFAGAKILKNGDIILSGDYSYEYKKNFLLKVELLKK